MLKNKTVQIVLSLLIGIALWLYVVGNVNPEISATIHGIQVEKINEDTLEDMDLEATLESPKIVDVVIKGSRSDVNEAKKSDIKAVVDVSNCNYGENEGPVEIEFPDEVSGVKVDSISVETAHFTVK